MDAAAFVDKWRKSRRSERSASQEHFLDLCEVLKHPKPGAVDPKGLTFTTERRVKKEGGKHGFADAWKKGFFGWEYKKKGADLNEAYNQLLQYSGDLGNPPLLVVSDMDRIEIRTRFTDYPTTNHVITLDTFATPANLEKLRCLFYEPEKLRPEKTIEKITEEAAKKLAELAPSMRAWFSDSTKVAHFLDRLIFCMFAEDVGLLPNQVFSQFLKKMNRDPRYVNRDIAQLFEAMANGGDFYGESIPHFNGNLFDNTPPLDLIGTEFPILIEASAFDWSEMDPSIFGTLFERVMDPAQRSQLGAHYTGFRDISTLVEPVIMAPLRREWTEALDKIASLAPDVIETRRGESLFRPADESSIQQAQRLVDAFLDRLRAIRVLDPACGSGNFLYVTNFHDGYVEMYDATFQLVKQFTDYDLPDGYAPFGIQNIDNKLYVTFAKQDAEKHDDVAGRGHGFVDIFSLEGHKERRLISRGHLNSPWGLALAPAGFGKFSGKLLVGNFGDGRIHAYGHRSGNFHGTLRMKHHVPIAIDGLWGLAFGSGAANNGPANALFFTAGPDDESHGLFGEIQAVTPMN